jgi:hypothetical protein
MIADKNQKPVAAAELTTEERRQLERNRAKVANRIVLAYHFTDKLGEEIPVSCPKRLLKTVQDLGVEKYGPTIKLANLDLVEAVSHIDLTK